jgi:Ku protein
MRAIWNGAIGFGLVNIPIKLYSATDSSTLDLDMLDSKDLSNIRFKRVNESTGKEVVWEDIVKGYKIEDKYIVLDDKDFEAASPENLRFSVFLSLSRKRRSILLCSRRLIFWSHRKMVKLLINYY